MSASKEQFAFFDFYGASHGARGLPDGHGDMFPWEIIYE